MSLTVDPNSSATPAKNAQAGGLREVTLLAIPVVLTNLSVTMTQLVDSAMVGRLGASELAAVGFGGIWNWTVMCFFMGLASAVQTFVSQHEGAGEDARCGAWTWQGVYCVVPLTAVVATALFFGVDPLMRALGISSAMQPLAAEYVEMRVFGNVALCGALAIASFFRGIGDTRTPLWCMLFANAVNVVLDYGLIFGELGLPAWGVKGAGVATAIAEVVYFLLVLAAFQRRRIERAYQTAAVAFDPAAVRRLLRTGLPIGGQWALEMASFAAFSTLVAHMSDASMAASHAFVMLLSLSFMQVIGIGTAVTTVVGRSIGADDPAAVQLCFRSGILLGGGFAAAVAALYLILPEQLVGFFSKDSEVLALARPLLLVGAAFQIFDALAIVTDGALRGAGDTSWPFWMRFLLSWGLFVPLAYLIGITLGGGLTGAWLGGSIYILSLSAVLVWRFQSGAWRSIRI